MNLPPLDPPARILLGPGPSEASPRVLRAQALPLVGHLDPYFVQLMDETMNLLRQVFGTQNRLAIPVSGTGSAGMEAAFVNMLSPGDRVVVGVNGVFGERMCDVARRCGAQVHRVEAEWGQTLPLETIQSALRQHRPQVLALVHAETSTGALQPLEGLSEAAGETGALLLVDTVTSLGGAPVEVDRNGLDICYSGTQKCLSAPPGLAPITFSEAALARLKNRSTPVQSWYLDMSMLEKYWGGERLYHHTAPISAIYGLREALAVVLEEGLEARYQRHRRNAEMLWAGLEDLGLKLVVDRARRIPSLTTVYSPDGVAEQDIRKKLLERYGIEIGGGLGPFKGRVWRIGLMGESSTQRNILYLLAALRELL